MMTFKLFEFRNAAAFTVIHELFKEYDRLKELTRTPVATHSFGTLTLAEAALLEAFRKADDMSKQRIQIVADITLQLEKEFASKPRCDVVDLSSARLPKE